MKQRGFTLLEVAVCIAIIASAGVLLWGTFAPAQQRVDDARMVKDLIALRDSLRGAMHDGLNTTELLNTDRLITRGLVPPGLIRWETRTLWTPWTDPLTLSQLRAPGDTTAEVTETLSISVSLASLGTADRVGTCLRLARAARSEFPALRVGTTDVRLVAAGTRDTVAPDEDTRIQTACATSTAVQVWV